MNPNPNDIIDAYEELERLFVILGPTTMHSVIDRVASRQPEPATTITVSDESPMLAPVIEPALDAVRTARASIETAIDDVATLRDAVDAIADTSTDGDKTCIYCGESGGSHWYGRHMRNSHWDDVTVEYAETGIPGLQETFDLSYATAYNWARRIDGNIA